MSTLVNYLDLDSSVCENFFDAQELSWHVWAIHDQLQFYSSK